MAAPQVPNWQAQILHGIGAPVTTQNVRFLNAWARAEGGAAENNPFNTTQPHAGAIGNYNSVGVKRYSSPDVGIAATVQTLRNGRYGNILAALHQGTDAVAAARALAASPWGTGSLVLKILGSGGGAPPSSPAAAVTPRPSPNPVPQGLFGLSPVAQQVIASNDAMLGIQAPRFDLMPAPQTPQPSSPAAPAQAPFKPFSGQAKPPRVSGSTVKFLEQYAAPFGLTVTSTSGGKHATNSYHYRGRAVDFGGDPRRMAALADSALHHGGWTELIYTGPGNPGYSILAGRVVANSQLPKALYEQHTNHVHLAR